MVGARTCAMAANRVIDRAMDARNPRTAHRHLPRGLLRVGELQALAVAGAVVLGVAAALLNPLCLALAPVALLFLVGYSYTKYFTWTTHWILGFTDGMAAAGAWLGVTGRLELPALVLWFALAVWIAGFDLIYACQDVEFDRTHGVHSYPARFGVAAALRMARLNHVLAAAALALLGPLAGLGWGWWLGWLAIVALLGWEHRLVRPHDLSRLEVAFFNVNGYIAVLALAAAVAGLRW
jgi:4-hydroxybenzoate polyprenyltransferase